jgi:hypothetical protein
MSSLLEVSIVRSFMGVFRDVIALELLIQAWALSYTKRVIPRSKEWPEINPRTEDWIARLICEDIELLASDAIRFSKTQHRARIVKVIVHGKDAIKFSKTQHRACLVKIIVNGSDAIQFSKTQDRAPHVIVIVNGKEAVRFSNTQHLRF